MINMATETEIPLGRSPLIVASVFLIAAIPIVSWLLQCNQRPKTFPPGPPTIPIFGNLHQMPTKTIYVKFAVSEEALCNATRVPVTKPKFANYACLRNGQNNTGK